MPYGKILVDQVESSTGKVLSTGQVTSELNAIARSLNVADSAVIYSTDTVEIFDGVLYIYDAPTQVTYEIVSKDLSWSPASGQLTHFNSSIPPYDCTIGGDDFWLCDSSKERYTPEYFFAVPDYDISSGTGTDNSQHLSVWAKFARVKGSTGTFGSSTSISLTNGNNVWAELKNMVLVFTNSDTNGITNEGAPDTQRVQLDGGFILKKSGSGATDANLSNGVDFSDCHCVRIARTWTQGWKNSGIKISNVRKYSISKTTGWLNDWDLSSAFATGGDILVYSSIEGKSRSGCISENWCLSNASQNIIVNSIGQDRDVIIESNHCYTYNDSFDPEDDINIVKRHCISIGYTSASTYGGGIHVLNNICRNAGWTGIYRSGGGDAEYPSSEIAGNKIYSVGFNSDEGNIQAGILLGNVVSGDNIHDNEVYDFMSAASYSYRIQESLGNGGATIRNNKDFNSAGGGVLITGESKSIRLIDHLSENAEGSISIHLEPIAGSSTFGDIDIINPTVRRDADGASIRISGDTYGLVTINNPLIRSTSKTSDSSVGIYIVRDAVNKVVTGGVISGHKWGVWYDTLSTSVQTFPWGGVTFIDCDYGYMLKGTSGENTINVSPNKYIGTTSRFGAVGGSSVGIEQLLINGVSV